jgi:uncharacterized protein
MEIMDNHNTLISRAESFVRDKLAGAEAGHDWWHIHRVRKLSGIIQKAEGGDLLVVELGALFHDIADAKFNGGDEEEGPAIARKFLAREGVSEDIIAHICQIISHISFRKGTAQSPTKEFCIVQDADRLDAMGAIGIARAFQYGGFKNRLLYDPEELPHLNLSPDACKKRAGHTINHFYEKLLLLKDLMNTATGRTMAQQRHLFMENFLRQFLGEWHLSDDIPIL